MAITKLSRKTEQIEADRARHDLAFLLPKSFPVNLEQLGREIEESKNRALNLGNRALATEYEHILGETLTLLTTEIELASGKLWVGIPKNLTVYTRADRLVEDYGHTTETDTSDEDNILAIPTSKITGAHGAILKVDKVGYEPSLDLRIQSSQDEPLTYFTSPGVVESVPSPGRWHRFPIGQTALALTT